MSARGGDPLLRPRPGAPSPDIAGRYADTELFSSNSSWRGVYVRMRFKFDEKSFRLADPATNRSLDSAAGVQLQ